MPNDADQYHRPALSEPAESAGRTNQPLLLLIPIAVAMALCILIFVVGLRFITAPLEAPSSGVVQNAAPAQAPSNPAAGKAG